MDSLNFGTLVFANEKEYYCALGAFCNKKAFSISYEPNKATGSYADAYRIRKLTTANNIIKPIKDALRSGNRINCNDFVKHILENHCFVQNGKKIYGTLENVIKTVPVTFIPDFIKGYTNSASTDNATMVVCETEAVKVIAKTLKKENTPQNNNKLIPKVQKTNKSFKKKHEYIKESIRNIDVGERGEKLVFEMEKEKIKNAISEGKMNPTKDYPKWISLEDDSAGYDILSYDADNNSPLYIEVKTTIGNKYSSFYMSTNEIDFSKAHKEQYTLYRVFNLKNEVASYFELKGDITVCAEVEIDAVDFLVSIK